MATHIGNAILCATEGRQERRWVLKIPLKPQEDRVRITVGPGDKALSAVSEALKDRSVQALVSVKKHLPMKFVTDQKTRKGGDVANLVILPQNLTRLKDGRGWSFEGQSMPESDFSKKGEPNTSTPVSGYISSETGEGNFSAVLG